MEDVYVVGVAMTPFGKFLDKSVKDLTREAVGDALADAGATTEDIGAAWFSNTTQGVMKASTVSRVKSHCATWASRASP